MNRPKLQKCLLFEVRTCRVYLVGNVCVIHVIERRHVMPVVVVTLYTILDISIVNDIAEGKVMTEDKLLSISENYNICPVLEKGKRILICYVCSINIPHEYK